MKQITLTSQPNKINHGETIGSILKSTRNKKGISLEDVSQKTYIKLHYLQALEDNRYDLLPAPVYTSGYIRQYAKLLGLEGTELVQRYHQQYSHQDHTFKRMADNQSHSDVREVKANKEPERVREYPRQENEMKMLDAAIQPKARYYSQKIVQPSSTPRSTLVLPREENLTLETTSPITDTTYHQANELIEGAKNEARLLRHNAEQYADQILRQLEEEIKKTLSVIKNGRVYLKNRLNNYR